MKREEAINKLRQMNLPKETMEILEAIAPELRESEDERIRKGLIEVVSDIAGGWPFEEHKITKKEALAYLEKQKEQKPASISCGHENDKPAEWDELQSEFRSINEAFEDGKKEVVAHPEKYGLCRPAEWSEEDTLMLTAIIQTLERFGGRGTTGMQIDWLKSLRSRPKSSDNWEQIMKEAVEVRVQTSPLNGPLGISAYCCNFPSEHPFYRCKEGDKVRVIIVKEEKNGTE